MKNSEENEKILEQQNKIRQQLVDQFIEHRKAGNLTQEELAYAMGITRPNISRFEAGQCNPTLDLLVKMAECMDLDIKIELVKRGAHRDE